jgi:fucose permease
MALKWAAFCGMLMFGVAAALFGAVLPIVSQRVALGLGQAGDLLAGMNFAMLASMVSLGPLMDRYGARLPLAAGAGLVAVGLPVIAAAGDWRGLLAGVMLLGAGGGALNGATNTLVADLHADPRQKASALNLLGVFFGVGALLLPFVIGALLEALGLARILQTAAGLSLALTAAYLVLKFPPAKRAEGVPLKDLRRLAREPLVRLFAALLFFQSGNEFTLAGYLGSYLTREAGFSIREASYWLAGYWASVMLARVAWSRVLLRLRGSWVVAGSALGTAAGVALLTVAHARGAVALGLVLTGISTAGIYPTVLAQAGARFQEHSGTVFGMLFAVALTGGMTWPWLAGQVAQSHGLRAGFLAAVAGALAIIGLQAAIRKRLLTERAPQ